MLASGGNDNKVCIWDLRGSRRPGVLPSGSGVPTTLNGSSRGIVGALGMPIASSSSNALVPAGGASNVLAPANAAASSMSGGEEIPGDQPLWKFHEHTAAVKALAWDPHVSGVLATGGGTQDKTIRFWNVFNGTMLNDLDTGSQVC